LDRIYASLVISQLTIHPVKAKQSIVLNRRQEMLESNLPKDEMGIASTYLLFPERMSKMTLPVENVPPPSGLARDVSCRFIRRSTCAAACVCD